MSEPARAVLGIDPGTRKCGYAVLLEAGVNVVTTAAFINGKGNPADRVRILAACEKGGSTIFGTGISPGFVELVGIATANLLPQISLSGSYGREGTTINNLFTPTGLVWSIASSITQPIFEGGTLRARQRAAQAALDVAAAQYSSTVNTAFQSVAETLRAALAAQKTAASSLAVARSQYTAGAGTYLNVLTAEQSDYSARLNLITARAARFSDTVALFQALGGGWWHRTDVDPKVANCCGVMP